MSIRNILLNNEDDRLYSTQHDSVVANNVICNVLEFNNATGSNLFVQNLSYTTATGTVINYVDETVTNSKAINFTGTNNWLANTIGQNMTVVNFTGTNSWLSDSQINNLNVINLTGTNIVGISSRYTNLNVTNFTGTTINSSNIINTTTVASSNFTGSSGKFNAISFKNSNSTLTAGQECRLETRYALTSFPVPALQPAQPNSVIAFDIAPSTGGLSDFTDAGVCWVDICDAPVIDNSNNVIGCLRLGNKSTSLEIGNRAFNGATVKPIYFTSQIAGVPNTAMILGTDATITIGTSPHSSTLNSRKFYIESTIPSVVLKDTDSSADQKIFELAHQGGSTLFILWQDNLSTFVSPITLSWSGSSSSIVLSSTLLRNDASNTCDIGSQALRFKDVYASTMRLSDNTSRSCILSAPQPATSSRTMTFQDVGSNANVIVSEGAQTINGVKTYGNGLKLPTSGGIAGTLDFYETIASSNESFSDIWAAPINATVSSHRIGNLVTLSVNDVSGTANTATTISCNMSTHIPTRFQSARTQSFPIYVLDDAVPKIGNVLVTAGSSAIDISVSQSDNFAGSGNSGFYAFTISWLVA